VLDAFGVSSSAETLYLQMLRDSTAGVRKIAQDLGWETGMVRSALDELSRLGLLRPSNEDPLALRAVSPDVGLEALLSRQQAELAARQQVIEQGRATLAMVVAEYVGTKAQGNQSMIEELVGVDAVRDRLQLMTARTRYEVLSLMPGGAQSIASLDAGKPLDAALLGRGVSNLTVYLDSVRNDQASTAYATWLTELGGQVRTTPVLPLRLIIVDRSEALIPIDPENSKAGAAVLTGHGAVAAMCALFDQIWTTATPLGLPVPRDEDGLNPQESELLRMLAAGETDERAARKLGISVRTVGRIASDLMGRLGARSRFQAGVRAKELGWLRVPEARKAESAASKPDLADR
jgi:DNA-binding CsgD family transcriptional regulator